MNYHTVMGHTTPLSIFGPDTTTPQGAASVAPIACTASTLRVVLESAPPVSVGISFTLQQGSTIATLTDTAVLCVVVSPSTSCNSGAAAEALTAGNLIVLKSLSSADLLADTNVFFGWTCQ